MNLESGSLSTSYPTVGHSLEDGNTKTIPIYPCFFRLSRTSILSPPSISAVVSSCESSETSSLPEPESVESALPQSSNVDCLSLRLSSPRSTISSHNFPIIHETNGKAHHAGHAASPSLEPYSSSLQPRSPTYIKIRRPSIPLSIRDVNDLTNLARYPIRLAKHEPSPALSRPLKFIRLYLRRASQISRRYSDRFDRHTIGLNGFSRASQSSWLADVFQGTMAFLDLAGFAEDSVTVEEGARGTMARSFVDIERSVNAEYALSTSMLWNGRL